MTYMPLFPVPIKMVFMSELDKPPWRVIHFSMVTRIRGKYVREPYTYTCIYTQMYKYMVHVNKILFVFLILSCLILNLSC